MIPEDVVSEAKRLFEYRERATKRNLPHDPDWPRVVAESREPALANERGATNQQQCAYQAIRLYEWESGKRPLPWTKAFLPAPVASPLVWYRRWWQRLTTWWRTTLKRLNGDLL